MRSERRSSNREASSDMRTPVVTRWSAAVGVARTDLRKSVSAGMLGPRYGVSGPVPMDGYCLLNGASNGFLEWCKYRFAARESVPAPESCRFLRRRPSRRASRRCTAVKKTDASACALLQRVYQVQAFARCNGECPCVERGRRALGLVVRMWYYNLCDLL